jgi:broad specificity phosphatase PhoE
MRRFWEFVAREVATANRNIYSVNRPKHILLVRHGQSEGNVDMKLYETKPDHAMCLTDLGREQAAATGKHIREKYAGDGSIRFIVSPYARTEQTLKEIRKAFDERQIISTNEDPRVREQDFGNFQDPSMNTFKENRIKFGAFYFRFPHGESGCDVHDRFFGEHSISTNALLFFRASDLLDSLNRSYIYIFHLHLS